MKISTKKILSTIVLVTGIFFALNAQTNVSGGIFANTTWTLAGSPYIVIDTTVVFPGVTLTIEPGVVVKFDDNMYLEIRQATLISIGTATDSITFTSNSSSPSRGIWGHANNGGIWLNGNPTPAAFNFCNIKYATRSVGGGTIQYLKNSSFTNNEYGFYNISFPVDSCAFKSNDIGISSLSNVTLNFCSISNNNFGVESSGNNVILNNCTINSNSLGFGGATGQTAGTKFYGCRISHNNTGVTTHSFAGNVFRDCIINYNTSLGIASYPIMGIDSIINCEIKFNGTGVTAQSSSGCVITQCEFEYDTIGIVIKNSSADIYCNKICNNISYGLKMDVSTNFNVSNNYWCTTDSTQIAAAIYDGYDNVAVGLVTFLPLDSLCYTSTGITAYEAQPASFSIFPNPAADDITIELPANSSKAEIKIYNMPGQLIYSSRLTKQKTTIDISAFRKGAYIIQIATADAISRQKLIRQ